MAMATTAPAAGTRSRRMAARLHTPSPGFAASVRIPELIVRVPSSPLAEIALVCAGVSALILLGYLFRRPSLGHATKVWLLLGLGVFPLGAAGAGNIEGFEATKNREFCGSCHVMRPHADDARDLNSLSLSSRHARNKLFGEESCYGCHADYGMFGTVMTKIGGMRHVWLYYT